MVIVVLLQAHVPTVKAHTLRAAAGVHLATVSGRNNHAVGTKAQPEVAALPPVLRSLAMVMLDNATTSNLTGDLLNVSKAVLNASEAIVNASAVIGEEVVNASEVLGEEVVNASEVLTSEVEEVIEEHPFSDAVLKAFFVVGIAEAFDRSWMATVLCAVQYGPSVAATGASVALMLQIFLTAGMGIASRELFDYTVLHLATAVVLGVMAMASAWNYCQTSPERMAITRRQAQEQKGTDKDLLNASASAAAAASKGWSATSPVSTQFAEETLAVFVLVFRAEMGDQTQLAMISLQSTEPLLAVSYGAMAAFGVMLVSACAIGSMMSGKNLREQTLFLISTVTFGIFSLTSLWQAFHVPLEVRAAEHYPITAVRLH